MLVYFMERVTSLMRLGTVWQSTAMDLTVEPGLPWESVQVTILQSNLCDGTTWMLKTAHLYVQIHMYIILYIYMC